MDFREIFQAAVRSIRAHILRSFLTTLGIMVGVAGVVAVIGLGQGLEQSILREVEKAGSQTIFVESIYPGDVSEEVYRKIQHHYLTIEDMIILKERTPQIHQVVPIFLMRVDIKRENRNIMSRTMLTDDSYLDVNGGSLAFGRNFVPSDLRMNNKVAILGSRVPDMLGIKGNPIGKYFSVGDLTVQVIGVLEEQGKSLDKDPDGQVIIPISTGMPLLTDRQRDDFMFQVKLNSGVSAENGAYIIENALRRIKSLHPQEPSGFKASTSKQAAEMIGKIITAITAVAGGMVSIALVVGGIGIMNIMLVSVMERTREIGVRRALGAHRFHILTQFLVEAAILSLSGGAIGMIIGYLLGLGLCKVLMGTSGGVPIWAVLSAFTIPVGIGVIFGFYPAARASKLDIIDALRYE